MRTAKSCGPDAAVLASSFRETSVSGMTEARKPFTAESIRPSLRNGFTAYFVLSPVNGFVATVAPEKLASQELDASTAASGPHDFAVRIMHVRLARIPRPPHLTARS